ncbi:hypothetical protein Tco_1146486 [Tanacetum coccineum]
MNIKIDPITSSFRVNEGSKFIPKLAELKYPIRKVRMRFETAEGSGWTNKAEEALQRIKRKFNKLQILAIPKEGQVVTDGPMEEILKLSEREGRLAKWAAEVRTYDISYIQIKEADGSVVKKFFGQGEQVQETPDANKGGTFNLSKKLQAKLTPTPRTWRLYLGKETIEEGSGVGIILVSPDEKMHSYVIRLKFNTFDHAIDCEALLAGLAASISKGMKDLHVFMDSQKLVARIEGNHTPAIEQKKRVGNHKVGISQSESIGRYQNKIIGGGDKQQQEGKSGKQCVTVQSLLQKAIFSPLNLRRLDQLYYRSQGEAIRIRVGGMTQDPLDGQQHIYSQFAPSSEQQVSFALP